MFSLAVLVGFGFEGIARKFTSKRIIFGFLAAVIIDELTQEDFNPQATVLLEDQLENHKFNTDDALNQQLAINNLAIESKVEIIKYEPERVLIKVNTAKPGFLVLTDTNFPGWEAKVNGQPAKIYQANYLFRAVKLGPGEYQVEFEYKPKEFYLGAKISLITLFFITIFSPSWLVKKRMSKS